MSATLFTRARVFDGTDDRGGGLNVLVDEGRIVELSEQPIAASSARVVDVGGRTLMPGLIDAHVHAFASDIVLQNSDALGEAYRTAHAVRMLAHAIACGFTTVRDIGGGNYSLYRALEDGLIAGPRFYYAARILSMTGGHGDLRRREDGAFYEARCGCGGSPVFTSLMVVADGVDECIKAAREQLRTGAHCIKIVASGGVASPTDPMWMNQYREDEIRAIVNECVERRTYVSAHCHPASAIRRSVDCGVRCIEHATLIDADTAAFVVERGAYVVPTMVIAEQLHELGGSMGFPRESQDKVAHAWAQSLSGLDIMRSAGVKMGFGTDLLGALYRSQCREFMLRAQVFSPLEILRQATSMNAEIMMLDGQLGCIAPGALADMLVVDGDPLKDISLLADDGRNLRVIMRAGELVKCDL
jgi:imidazolonepropionase-like amidohydrolase